MPSSFSSSFRWRCASSGRLAQPTKFAGLMRRADARVLSRGRPLGPAGAAADRATGRCAAAGSQRERPRATRSRSRQELANFERTLAGETGGGAHWRARDCLLLAQLQGLRRGLGGSLPQVEHSARRFGSAEPICAEGARRGLPVSGMSPVRIPVSRDAPADRVASCVPRETGSPRPGAPLPALVRRAANFGQTLALETGGGAPNMAASEASRKTTFSPREKVPAQRS
jgi:hypothetical protein